MYTKSSVSLLIAGGLLFLLINCNITELYALINKPEYNAGITVVILVSVSELIKLALGTNAAILSNSKYYRSFFYYSIAMSVSVIVLNKYLIEIMGINGAALSTLIVIFVFSLSRIMYVQKKMQMQPFTAKTWVLLGIIAVLFLPFYFMKITEMPVISIFIKSIVISILYLFLVFKFRISEDFRSMVLQFNKK
jgi:O-antigen/teichoic acid export membrane protein